MKINKLVFLIPIVLLSWVCSGQSLEGISDVQDKAYRFSFNNIDSAKYFIDKSKKLLKEELSFDFYNLSEIENSTPPFERLASILKQLHIEALISENEGDFNRSLEQNFNLLKICDAILPLYIENKDDILKSRARTLGNIGGIHLEMNTPDKALYYYFSSDTIFSEIENTERSRAINLSNIAALFEQKEMVDSALYFYDKAIDLSTTIQDSSLLALNIGNQAITLMNDGRYDQSLRSFKEAIGINKSLNQVHSLAYKYGNLGYLYFQTNQYDSAEFYYNKGIYLSDSLGNKNLKKDQLLNLSILLDSLGREEEAFEAYKSFVTIKDSIFNEENIRQQTLTEAQYNFDKQQALERVQAEKEKVVLLEEQKRQRITLYFLMGIVLLLGFFIFIVYRVQKLKSQKQKIQAENRRMDIEYRLLRSQMNPHFLFNALNTINTYILNDENLKASDALQKFSTLVRQLLKQSTLESIYLEDELNMVKKYIQIEEMRFSNRFEYEIEISKEVDPTNMKIPGMLIQPFVENAILHGLSSLKTRKGKLRIFIELLPDSNDLKISIFDNGVGRSNKREEKSKNHESLSIKLIEERLFLLRKKQGSLQIEDLKEGTKVELIIPFVEEF